MSSVIIQPLAVTSIAAVGFNIAEEIALDKWNYLHHRLLLQTLANAAPARSSGRR